MHGSCFDKDAFENKNNNKSYTLSTKFILDEILDHEYEIKTLRNEENFMKGNFNVIEKQGLFSIAN